MTDNKAKPMNRKFTLFLILLSVTFIVPNGINSQEDQLIKGCIDSLRAPYVLGDRSMKAFLTGDEVAEFRTTFFKGNTYRIVSCSYEPYQIQFSVYDSNRNLLFSSADFSNVSLWDFKMDGSMECIIEARLNKEIATSGMAFLLVGFRYSE
jgi:hypothetical protein